MGGVAVVHLQDVLKDRSNYLRHSYKYNNHLKPLISSSSSNPSMKSQTRSPNFIPNSNPNPNLPKSSSDRRRRNFQKKQNSNVRSDDFSKSESWAKNNNGHLVMGQVRILKRGESLADYKSSCQNGDLDLGKKEDEYAKFDEGVGSLVMKDLVVGDMYAGSAFYSSPSPRSVPLPAFFKNKSGADGGAVGVLTEKNDNDDDATSGLLRLLKLDL